MELNWFCFPEYIGSESSFASTSISNAENLAHIELEDIQDPEIITLSENISLSDQGPEEVSEEIQIVVGKYIIFYSYEM